MGVVLVLVVIAVVLWRFAARGQLAQALLGIVAGFFLIAGLEFTTNSAIENGDITFYSLMLAAPMFTAGLVALLINRVNRTNYLLEEMLEAFRSDSHLDDEEALDGEAPSGYSPSGTPLAQPSLGPVRRALMRLQLWRLG